MNLRAKPRIITLICVLVMVTVFLQGCRYSWDWVARGTKLEFKTITMGNADGSGPSESGIIVLASAEAPSPAGFDLIESKYDRPLTLATDFSKCFVVVAFNGQRPVRDSDMLITDVRQKGAVVYVRAQFVRQPFGTVVAAETSPYHIVQVDKANMPRFGKLAFILLDDYGKERARTTAVIQPPKAEK